MRYLILAAGMGKRMGAESARNPKCLLDIGGEPLIGRLLRQIRAHERAADVYVVVGYRAEAVVAAVPGCEIVVNPFFDITGVNASLWFARAAFDRPVMLIHGDVVLSDDLAADLFTAESASLIAFDSSVQDPKEINLATADGRVTRFGVNFDGFAGAYAGILKLSERAANARYFSGTSPRCHWKNSVRPGQFPGSFVSIRAKLRPSNATFALAPHNSHSVGVTSMCASGVSIACGFTFAGQRT